jgi:hypothetical protein
VSRDIPLCPEALYGQHGEANTSGNCPYCGYHLGRSRSRVWLSRRAYQDSLSGGDRSVDAWGRVDVPWHQDPLEIDFNEDVYYL